MVTIVIHRRLICCRQHAQFSMYIYRLL